MHTGPEGAQTWGPDSLPIGTLDTRNGDICFACGDRMAPQMGKHPSTIPCPCPQPSEGREAGEGLSEALGPSIPPPSLVPLGLPGVAWGAARLGAALSDPLAALAKMSVEFRGVFRGREFFQKVHNYDTCGLWGDRWPWPARRSPPPAHLPGKAAATGSAVAPSGLQGEDKKTPEWPPKAPKMAAPRTAGTPQSRPAGPTWTQLRPSCPLRPHFCLLRAAGATPGGSSLTFCRCLPVYTGTCPRTEAGAGASQARRFHSPRSRVQSRSAASVCKGCPTPGRGAAQERADAPGPLRLALIFQWQLGSVGGGAVGHWCVPLGPPQED